MTAPEPPRRPPADALLAGGLLALLLYAPVLRLPLIYDTLLHIRIAKGLDFATVWLPTEAFGFYRPLTFLPLLVVRALFGGYPAGLLQGMNLAQHAANPILLAWLSWRLYGDRRRALVAGLLLAVFPFAYQAVAVYGHNVHPATANLILLGLHAALSAVREAGRRRRIGWAATAACFVLALLSHESAILFGPLAWLTVWSSGRSATARGLLRPPRAFLAFTFAGMLYAGVYQFLPITRAPQAGGGPSGDLWPRLLYLGQDLAYPFTQLAHRLPDLSAMAVVAGGLALTGLLAVVAWRAPARRASLLAGLGWWAMASLVIAVPLSADYLLHGPRLLYLGGVGLALFWATLVTALDRLPAGGRVVFVVAVIAFVGSNALLVRARLGDYKQLTASVTAARAAAADRPEDEGLLLINLPAWIGPPRSAFPVGAELAAMLGPYLFVEELTEQNGIGARPAWASAVPDLLARPDYPYAVHGQTPLAAVLAGLGPAGAHVVITRYADAGPLPDAAGRLRAREPGRAAVALLGPYALIAAEATGCDGEVQTRLTWQQAGPAAPEPTHSIFVQALDGAGAVAGQADGPPLGLRPDLLPLGDAWEAHDTRRLAAPGAQSVLVGVYDYTTGRRLPARTARGALPDEALRLPVAACPGP